MERPLLHLIYKPKSVLGAFDYGPVFYKPDRNETHSQDFKVVQTGLVGYVIGD